jgi:hypothetical protein
VLPACPDLLAARAIAETYIALPPPRHITGRAHCDGSCTNPTDPLISRAAWNVSGPGPHGILSLFPAYRLDHTHCTLAQQRVSGKQTIGRAELSALVWLSTCTGSFSVCTDCQYLQKRFARLNTEPMPPSWLEGINGDLWRLVQRTDIVVTWISSHVPLADVPSSGFSWEDWLGNQAADIAAGLLAATLALPPAVVALRARTLAALDVVYQVLSTVEETVLARHHAPDHPIAKRRKRAKRFKAFRPKRRALVRPRPPVVAPGGDTCGAHSLVFGSGPAPSTAPATGNISWPLACSRCSRCVTGSNRWKAFAISRCFSDPMAAHHRRSTAVHSLERCIGGWYCSRCQLAVSSSRRAAASRAQCPVPLVTDGTGMPLPMVQARYCSNLAALTTWRTCWASLAPVAAVALTNAAHAPAALTFAAALSWRPHWEIAARAGGNVTGICLRCGLCCTRRLPRKLAACPCAFNAVAILRGPAKAALLAGACDAALQSASAAMRDRAIFLGWAPVAVGTGPA